MRAKKEIQDELNSDDPVKAFVERFYLYILGRKADPAGLEAWTSNLKSGKEDGVAVGAGFIESPEFKKIGIWMMKHISEFYTRHFLIGRQTQQDLKAGRGFLMKG